MLFILILIKSDATYINVFFLFFQTNIKPHRYKIIKEKSNLRIQVFITRHKTNRPSVASIIKYGAFKYKNTETSYNVHQF
jgi:hypothetical protein